MCVCVCVGVTERERERGYGMNYILHVGTWSNETMKPQNHLCFLAQIHCSPLLGGSHVTARTNKCLQSNYNKSTIVDTKLI